MKKAFLCLIITLCLFGCQTTPTTEEILRTQTEHFLELTDTLPVMPEDLFDDAKTLEERTALAEDWAAQLQDYLSPVMTDKAIEAFVANRMPEGFNRFLGFEETMQTQDCRQISNVEKLSGGDYDVTVTYTADEQTVKLLLNFKETADGWRITSLRRR